jgi:hypothetical protein
MCPLASKVCWSNSLYILYEHKFRSSMIGHVSMTVMYSSTAGMKTWMIFWSWIFNDARRTLKHKYGWYK